MKRPVDGISHQEGDSWILGANTLFPVADRSPSLWEIGVAQKMPGRRAQPERHWTRESYEVLVDPTADLLVKLPSLNKAGLRELWQKSFNRPASPRLRRELMAPILAFRIQELAHGGLTPETKAKLHEIRSCLSPKAQNDAQQRFKSGTRL